MNPLKIELKEWAVPTLYRSIHELAALNACPLNLETVHMGCLGCRRPHL